MPRHTLGPDRMTLILDYLKLRYEYDAMGRMVGVRDGGVLPRFVLGRAPEGCIWRFRADLPEKLLPRLAKLAGREPGLGVYEAGEPAPPERLALIAALLGGDAGPAICEREAFEDEGRLLAEVFTLR